MSMRAIYGHDVEAAKAAQFRWSTVARAWRFVRRHRAVLAVLLTSVAVGSALGVVPPLLLRRLLDRAIPRHDLHGVDQLAMLVVAVMLLQMGIRVGRSWLSSRVAAGVTYDMRTSLFDHLQRMPISFFTRTQTGAVLTRLLTDVTTAQALFTTDLATLFSTVFTLSFTMVAMFTLSWRLSLALLVGIPLVVLPPRWMGTKMRQLVKARMDLHASMNSFPTERFNVAGALLVKLFGTYDRELASFAEKAAEVQAVSVRQGVYSAVFSSLLGLSTVLGTFVIYWFGAREVASSAITVGTLVAVSAYMGQLYGPVRQISSARIDVMTSMVAFERVFEVIDAPLGISDAPDAVALEHPRGRVELDAVWFRYRPDTPLIASLEAQRAARAGDAGAEARRGERSERPWVLSGVSFVAEPGTMTALVGPTGAGKTTLCSLVPRLYDVISGSIKLDGHDVRGLSHESLAAAIGVVTQDVHLFHESVAANLRYAKPYASDADLADACRAAQIHDFISGLAEGYDTIVGERGYRFSGGEKQRLAIARVLLKDPAIVILDEATAHLDSETEVLVQQALITALTGRTSIVIAHRLSTVRSADQIVVLNRGRIVERGRHDELLEARGLYRDLYDTQFAASPGISGGV